MGKRGRTPVTYTLERAKIVQDRVHSGERLTAVCADLGMDVSNFLRWCRRNRFVVNTPAMRTANRFRKRGPSLQIGQPPAKLRQPRPGGRAARIAADLQAGLAPAAAAQKYGVSYGYAVRLRREIGAAPPPGPGRNTPRSPEGFVLRTRDAAIRAAHRAGITQSQLALVHRLTRSRIQQIIAAGPRESPPHRP